MLIPMDLSQRDHLKAYGIAYWTVKQGGKAEWLLNYRGGSFLCDHYEQLERLCRIRGVSFESTSATDAARIYAEIEGANMEVVPLEKAPKIAVYAPSHYQPWDDAVLMALTYAEIPYDRIYDEEVLRGQLSEYDWLHLHHEDFTGQYGKFFRSYKNADWYREEQADNEARAKQWGYASVSEMKKGVAREIKSYVGKGGFLFAMCSGTDSYDVALAAEGVDIVDVPFDGDPPDKDAQARLDYNKCLAFQNFKLITDPNVYEFSDIDMTQESGRGYKGEAGDYFTLFEFSAKYDPVPSMLTQDHTSVVKGFMGQTTSYRRSLIKPSITIMGDYVGREEVKYIHGNFGDGSWTFYGGHDPEDYRHLVGDPPTNLELHKNSPGYRLILNNVLFPAAKKKKLKT
ncbi:asparagine synthetase B [bacterium]|nr:asparagine synthetase B [bacterium]